MNRQQMMPEADILRATHARLAHCRVWVAALIASLSIGLKGAEGLANFHFLRHHILSGVDACPGNDMSEVARSIQEWLIAFQQGHPEGTARFAVVTWLTGGDPITTPGDFDGASITMHALCNVQVPPNFCQEGGSAVTFMSDADGRSLRGLVTFYPRLLDDPIRDTDFITGIERAADFLLRIGPRVPLEQCIIQQIEAGAVLVDLTNAAQCMHQWSMRRLQNARTPEQLPHIPRSVLVVGGNFGRSLPHGMHASLIIPVRWFHPDGNMVLVQMLLNIQP